jgi:RNA polymerase sigma factor (TIGR02999 family)
MWRFTSSLPAAHGRASGWEAHFAGNGCHGAGGATIEPLVTADRAATDGRPHDVTALLMDWRAGDEGAIEKLMPLVHGELRRIAKRHMAGERRDHVLQATALVNEVYLRLIDVRRIQWQDRAHFFAMAARLMRRVLVDVARAQRNQKRGGGLQRVTFDQDLLVGSEMPEDVLAIDAALHSLAAEYARKAQVVELRFFGGMSVEETAEVLQISPETVMRDWKFAKSWLLRALSRPAGGAP